jgi:hypothetical protein
MRFFDCAHFSLFSLWGYGYDLSVSFKKKKTPYSDPALCGIPGRSFTLYLLILLEMAAYVRLHTSPAHGFEIVILKLEFDISDLEIDILSLEFDKF